MVINLLKSGTPTCMLNAGKEDSDMDVNRVKMLQAMSNDAPMVVCECTTEAEAKELALKLTGCSGRAVYAKGCKVLTESAEVMADRDRLLAKVL